MKFKIHIDQLGLKQALATVLFIFCGLFSQAQQVSQPKQFFNNPLIYNPAAAGMQEEDFNLGLMTQLQWTAIKGAPFNNFLWSDYRFAEKNMAVGLNVNYLKWGPNTETDFMANYSFHLQLGKGRKLGMGLRAGVSNIKFDPSELSPIDANDPNIPTSTTSYLLPKFGLGFWYNSRVVYAGASSPDLLISDSKDYLQTKDKGFLDKKRNIILNAGAKIKLGDQYVLNPNVIYYYYPGTTSIAHLNLNLIFTDYFWLGGAYITNQAYSLNAGTYVGARFKLGYAYQGALSDYAGVKLNTHEINLIMSLDDLF